MGVNYSSIGLNSFLNFGMAQAGVLDGWDPHVENLKKSEWL